ncbi:vWA domain-containing protein [Nannocystis radixulma]|uniref:VWA-like domain-containing protein n=1 Tax=Nannocystis radixulma TaxID=2995305 RepID=A0ABT5BI22_9BACT|nr:VWA-like domain-containing protein [Nannocystis radixulma]MDC0673800.1 VWA-like domain-containing protein [Nannocystis radixulma]
MARRRNDRRPNPALEDFQAGRALLEKHPIFAPLLYHARIVYESRQCPEDGRVVVSSGGALHVNWSKRAAPEEWAHVLAHALLHLGLDHFREMPDRVAWQAACDCCVARLLRDLRFGRLPDDMLFDPDLPARSEELLYQRFVRDGVPPQLLGCGTAGPRAPDMLPIAAPQPGDDQAARRAAEERKRWQGLLAGGLVSAVDSAVEVAAGLRTSLSARASRSPAARARAWFISSYPLLGSLAAAFDLIEDPQVCQRMQITVAAIDAEARELYVNPAAHLDDHAARFVVAHELLHVGLRHQARRQGRDPYLWNVACDFVINGWLVEMGIGELPAFGLLYDPELKGLSAEAIYDRIVVDLRRYRKLATLRGFDLGDMLGDEAVWQRGEGMTLDAFFRRCLSQGLAYHQSEGRGLLPAGLVEEIRALAQPPIPWDVELAKWFDERFSPLERRRSFARASRRQSATPDIPRPMWVPGLDNDDGRTFGVLLDTSGSMDRKLLAKALGAIASYAIARDVSRVRVVFCDAAVYDEGYLPPEVIADRVRVRGRGGTILQPGIDLLERAEDFPPAGPLLIITDGMCDRLHVRRDHAFLVPEGRHLPFVPKGKVFRIC